MTREEAINHFSYGISHDIFKEPVTSYARMAVEALREQEERSKGCEWCISLEKNVEDFKCGDLSARGVVEHTFWGDGRMYTQIPKFCPMCGRKLEVEE